MNIFYHTFYIKDWNGDFTSRAPIYNKTVYSTEFRNDLLFLNINVSCPEGSHHISYSDLSKPNVLSPIKGLL